ncbi:hypothetical protein ACQ4M4_10195 [Leptolyngbya sp. AN02str]|uniref:hypothetical protein n=1 Tax=Leptolyngbya sp. AN02str TaxID=3423363 RepID=UPI003D31DD54
MGGHAGVQTLWLWQNQRDESALRAPNSNRTDADPIKPTPINRSDDPETVANRDRQQVIAWNA